MAFSASEAAFEGFRVVRREPKSVLAWAVLEMIVGVALMVVLQQVVGPLKVDLPPAIGAAGARAAPSPAALAAMGRFMGAYLMLLPFELLFFAVLSAAVYRTVLRPEDEGFARLRLGLDELRLAGVWVLIGLLMLGISLALALVGALLMGGAALALRSSPGLVGLSILVLYLGMLAVLVWIGVRLSLAGPMTFASKRIHLFASWGLTKGRFWSLFGCYLLASIFVVLISIVTLVIQAAVTFGASGGSLAGVWTGMMRPDMSSLQAYFTPARLITLPISAAVAAVFWAVAVAPAARAYKDITGLSPDAQAEAFS